MDRVPAWAEFQPGQSSNQGRVPVRDNVPRLELCPLLELRPRLELFPGWNYALAGIFSWLELCPSWNSVPTGTFPIQNYQRRTVKNLH